MPTIKRTTSGDRTRIDLLLDDDTSASHLSVVDLPLRVGNLVVRCGGIAGVGTDREQRNKGYARAVLEDSLAFMRQEGYPLSALFGISDFYPKFGYAPALVECSTELATRYAERASARFDVREARPEDVPAIAAIYQQTRAYRTASISRDPASWRGFRRGTHWDDRVGCFLVVDGERLLGYAAHDLNPWRCALSEVGVIDPAAYSTIVAKAAQLAWEKRCETITVHAPADDPFVRHCRRYGARIEVTYPCCSGGMARVVDQSALFAQLEPLLGARLQSALPGWEGTLSVATELGSERLRFGHGARQVAVEMPQGALAQLALGFRSAAEAATEGDTHIGEGALPVLGALFPAGYPYIDWSDRF